MMIFLNDDLDQVRQISTAKMGSLRLYSEGSPLDEVYDVIPRLGRAVLFKSEETLHQVTPTLEYDNYAATIHFSQVVKKDVPAHPIPADWSIFVNIISYRDPYLLSTLKNLVKLADHPERLHIAVFNQVDPNNANDQRMLQEVQAYIQEAQGAAIVMEAVPHSEFKDAYHARYRVQQHYNGETYQLQLDSRHRATQGWDVSAVTQLHSCDAGELSVLTGYLRPFQLENPADPNSKPLFADGPPLLFSQDRWNEDGMPNGYGRPVDRHADQLTRPFETMYASGHFTFSHGDLLKKAGHDGAHDTVFAWEELWMTHAYWTEGYTLYAPSQTFLFHNGEIGDGPDRYSTAEPEVIEDPWNTYEHNGKRMRDRIIGDGPYIDYMDARWGVDLLGREGSVRSADGGFDAWYFFDIDN